MLPSTYGLGFTKRADMESAPTDETEVFAFLYP